MKKNKDLTFFKNFLDRIPDPLLAVKKDNLLIEYINHEGEVFFSKSSNFLLGKNLSELFYKDSYFLGYLKKLLSSTGVFLLKDIPFKDVISAEIRCILPEENKDFFFIIIKKKEDQNIDKYLDNNQFSILDETLSILMHEINNPLSSIKLAAQILEKNIQNSDSELIEIIKKETSRVIEITERLSGPNANFLNVVKKKENIHEIIRYSTFKLQLKKNKIKIIENFDPSLPDLEIDKNLFIQVFENLILNAIESSKNNNNSYLKISTSFLFGHTIRIPNVIDKQKQNFVEIIIEDNGIGIKKENLEKIFNPFYTTKKKGSGIGLYLVKKIINAHYGFIEINSLENITKILIRIPI